MVTSTSHRSVQQRNGAFTEALLEGISTTKADLNGDGVLTDQELAAFMGNTVKSLTGGKQHFVPFKPPIPDFPLFGVIGN